MKFDTILENKNRGSIDWTIPKGWEISDELQFYVEGSVVRHNKPLRIMGATSRNTVQTCYLRIFRLGWYDGSGARKIHHSDGFEVKPQKMWNRINELNPDLPSEGPSWKCCYELMVPENWCDGLHIIKIENEDGKATLVPFWLTTPHEAEGVTICFSPINIQARNWWGGASATQVVNGKARKAKSLYHQIGSETLSLNRPMFNPRGGDFLRWAYPLVRFLERHDVPITYITDVDIERAEVIPEGTTHLVTVGPMRYWTNLFDDLLTDFVEKGGKNYIHLGSEAGQHLISLDLASSQIKLHGEYGRERLNNPLTGARPSGSKPRPPWGRMRLSTNHTNSILEGMIGSSWDKSTDQRQVLASGKGRHKLFRQRLAQTTIRKEKGVVFNAGVANWTWALSAFGRQGNILVSEDAQRLTLEVLGQDISILNSDLDSDMILDDDDEISTKSLDELEEILIKKPDNFHALLYSGIRLFDKGQHELAHPRFVRAHQIRPRSILATYRLARNHHKMGDFQSMLPLYHELLRQRPNRFHYVQQYATLLFSLGEEEEGLRAMNLAISIRPEEPAPYVSLGHHARVKGDYDTARRHLTKALTLDKAHHGALAGLAALSDAVGEFEQAKSYWKNILSLYPKNERALMGLGKSLYRSGEYDEAYDVLRLVIEKKIERYIREAGNYCINIACNHFVDDLKIIDICTVLLDEYLELMDSSKNGHVPVTQLVLALSRQKHIEQAISILQRHRDLYRNSSEFALVKAQIHFNAGETQLYFEAVQSAFSSVHSGAQTFDSSDQHKKLLVNSLSATNISPKDGPLVSVIMTVYKQNELLESAIQSVLNQSYRNLELIIVDDCSPDDVHSFLENIARTDDRIRVHRMKKNGGTYLAKNHGLGFAKGKYVAFHDSDDWLHPEKLEVSVGHLEGNDDCVAVFSNYFRVDENGRIVFRGIGAVRPACISLTMRREAVMEKLGYFDSVRVSADSEYEYRILSVFGEDRVMYLPKPFLIASVRSESLSQGGKFAVGWSGLSGLRLEYRQAYTEWHRSSEFEQNPYMPKERAPNRRFDAPEEMIW